MMTEVCSIRDVPYEDRDPERDVLCTRPGIWGNRYTLEQYGWRALDLYRHNLRSNVASAQRIEAASGITDPWLTALKGLAGKRLLCACPSERPACHVWCLAEVVEELTAVPVKPAPGRERGLVRSIGQVVVCDDDGFHREPERYAEGWVVTAEGRHWLKENTVP